MITFLVVFALVFGFLLGFWFGHNIGALSSKLEVYEAKEAQAIKAAADRAYADAVEAFKKAYDAPMTEKVKAAVPEV